MIYISEDGYFATNIFDYEYSYFIGKEAAGQIISYVQKHSTETKSSTSLPTISGTVTEIGNGYITVSYTHLDVYKRQPMTETSFYILLCLRTPNHGYGIVQKVKELTDNEVVLGPGTMYGSLSKMEKDGLIHFIREEDKRKIYEITELGTEVLELELKRIRRLSLIHI